jgi:hypothetical protein
LVWPERTAGLTDAEVVRIGLAVSTKVIAPSITPIKAAGRLRCFKDLRAPAMFDPLVNSIWLAHLMIWARRAQ